MLVDASVLLFAQDESSAHHLACLRWLTDALNGPFRIGLPWPSLLAFVRIRTHPRAYARPLTPDVAWDHVTEWLDAPSAWVPTPTDRHAEVLGELIRGHELRGNMIPDAHLAALALEHGTGVCSVDTDFARFPDLRWFNPAAGS